jgi:hypothetical protein
MNTGRGVLQPLKARTSAKMKQSTRRGAFMAGGRFAMALRSARTAFTASGEAALHSTHESPLKGVAYGIHPSNWCMSEFPLRTSNKRCAKQRDAPTQEKMHEGGMSVCGGA